MKNTNITRKDFLKILGGTAAAATALAHGCTSENQSGADRAPSLDDIVPEKMTYRTNPKTGDKVSLLGYGCMRLPMKEISKTQREIDQQTWNELVDIAISKGVNYFDTSPAYTKGLSERATGIALARHPREKYFIATKLSNFRPETQTREASIAMYRNSFKELRVDCLDYYLLHAVGLGGMQPLRDRYLDNGMLDFLLEEREAGRIGNLGWSFHGDVKVFDHLLAMDIKWDFVQIQLNYMDWKHASGWNVNAEYLYDELAKRKIPAVIMEPLLGGRLANIPTFVAGRLKAKRPEDSIASWAFRYAGSPSNVLTVLSGMTYKDHLLDDLHTYAPLTPVSDEEKALLEEVALKILEYPLVHCTQCDYCMPCPYGIDIPGIFAHYNRCINERYYPQNKQDENYREARRAFLIGYDRSVPRLRQANHCINCGKCEPLCPQRIRISREMNRIDKYIEQLKQGTLPEHA